MDKFFLISFVYILPMTACLAYWYARARLSWDGDSLGPIIFALAFIPAINWFGVLAVILWSLMDIGYSLSEKVGRRG